MPYNNKHIKGWIRVLLLILPYIFVVGMFGLLGHLITGVDIADINAEKTTFQQFIISLFNFVGTIIIIPIFIKVIDYENIIDIGLRLKNRLKDMLWGISLGLIIMGFALLILLFIDEINFINFNFELDNLIYMFLLFVFVSFSEEILLRGYVLRNFMYSFNKYIALILSSLIFALMHGANPHIGWISLFDLFLAGILLGISYTYTKNLWFPIALHFSWNFFQSLFGFNVSGLDTYSLIEFDMAEPNLINGGKFGFEGSILSIIVQVILIIAIYLWYLRKQTSTHATE